MASAHYIATPMALPSGRVADRFWRRVEKGDGCWNYQGATFSSGYGAFYYDGQNVGAHRFSFLVAHGQPTPGLFVCHRCDNKRCVRPDHLFEGTPKQNYDDADSKGRLTTARRNRARGEMAGSARLATAQVRQIRASWPAETRRALAARFGVSKGTIDAIVYGRTWRHV